MVINLSHRFFEIIHNEKSNMINQDTVINSMQYIFFNNSLYVYYLLPLITIFNL